VHKLSASIHENDLDQFEAWFASEFAGRKDGYSVESFKQDPKSTGVLYAVSLKIARQGDVETLKTYVAGLAHGATVKAG
jgi:hypothetical protein